MNTPDPTTLPIVGLLRLPGGRLIRIRSARPTDSPDPVVIAPRPTVLGLNAAGDPVTLEAVRLLPALLESIAPKTLTDDGRALLGSRN